MTYIITAIAVIAFLYFGYKDDFKRDKENSTFLVIMILVAILVFFLASKINLTLACILCGIFLGLGRKYKAKIIQFLFRKKSKQ